MVYSLPSPAASFDRVVGLDGLRAVAVSLVVAAHLGLSHIVPGGFGVTLFFFISGLLITRLLLAEWDAEGRIALGKFYIRRLLRLYPALVVAITLGGALTVAFGGTIFVGELVALLLYVFNYYGLFLEATIGSADIAAPFGVFWSLSIEEQYYALYPMVVGRLAGNPRRFIRSLVIVIVLVLVWRIAIASLHGNHLEERIYRSTDTRVDSILYGAVLALILNGPAAVRWTRWASQWRILLLSIGVLIGCFVLRDPFFRNTVRYSLQGIALMPLVTAICFSSRLAPITRALESRPAVLIGKWSYAMYLLHPIAIMVFEQSALRDMPVASAFGAFALTITAAYLTHHEVERRFVGLRRTFGSHAGHGSRVPENRSDREPPIAGVGDPALEGSSQSSSQVRLGG